MLQVGICLLKSFIYGLFKVTGNLGLTSIYIYRVYYTVARRYEFYFRVLKTIFLSQENKIHIFKPPGNFLFIIWTRVFCTNNSVRAGNDVINILTSKAMENLYIT